MNVPSKSTAKRQGAKPDYSYWKSDEGIQVIGQWKRNGLTNAEICDKIGIHHSTLYEWKKECPTLDENLKYTKEIADTRVENALFEQALKGNMQAIYFYLKNRKPSDYRERQEIMLDSAKKEAVESIKDLVDKVNDTK